MSTYCVLGTVLKISIICEDYPQCLSTSCMPSPVLGDSLAVWGELSSRAPPPWSVCSMRSELLLCALSVLPTLEVSQEPVAGDQVKVTCQVKKFYPQRLQLTC